MRNVFALNLEDVANWQVAPAKISPDSIRAEIPAFQRGLVWNPAQVEVLWDSLLRQIPIGALSLLPVKGAERYSRDKSIADGAYWILDGQQRANAIALGFRPFGDGTDILWIDLKPQEELRRRSNRKYFFYLTTASRPWGSVISDASGENRSGKVSPSDCREAMTYLKRDEDCYAKPDARDQWPVCAGLPIPFSVFRDFAQQDKGILDYLESSKGTYVGVPWFENYCKAVQNLGEQRENIVEIAAEIKAAFERAKETPVMALVAPSSLSIEDGRTKTDDDLERDSEIAVYFTRLNRGGTMPSGEDLNYSILKAANPDLASIDQFSKNRMHPARMARYAMQFYKSQAKKKMVGSVSRRDAYQLGRDSEFAAGLDDFKNAVEKVDDWLLYRGGDDEGVPAFVRTQIAWGSPNLYLFLMLFARSSVDIGRNTVIALTTLLLWFGKDGQLDFDTCLQRLAGSTYNTIEILREWLFAQINSPQGRLALPPPVEAFNELSALLSSEDRPSLGQIEKSWTPAGFETQFNEVWYWDRSVGRGIVLYACRRYLRDVFSDYDPASAVWNEDNRPWDYDHVVPRSWLVSRKPYGKSYAQYHQLVYEFINCIGNIVPLPFSMNRSKHDSSPGDNYMGSVERRREVLIPEESVSEKVFTQELGGKLEGDPALAYAFARISSRRMAALYGEWAGMSALQDLLDFSTIAHPRREMIKGVLQWAKDQGRTSGFRVVYVSGEKQIDVRIKGDGDLARPWLACGLPAVYRRENGTEVDCFACVLEQDGAFEVGLRRSPESDQPFDGDGDEAWWLRWEELSKDATSIDEALCHLKSLANNESLTLKP